jgi:glycosyltransferase involved in cell wall biosynthesis
MFVLNDCRSDARVLREAATLQQAGHQVTIMARTTDPYAAAVEREVREGFEIVRVPVASGALRWLLIARRPAALVRAILGSLRPPLPRTPGTKSGPIALALLFIALVPVLLAAGLVTGVAVIAVRVAPGARTSWSAVRWRLQWRFSVVPWSRSAVDSAPPGDVLHAHDLPALPAAILARDRSGDRTSPAVIYDSHEIFVEAGANAASPAAARRGLRNRERRLARHADALITVNEAVAAVLGEALDMTDRTVVVRNCIPRWQPPASDPGLLRSRAGIPADVPIALSHGSLVAHRGLERSIAALDEPELAGVHLVLMGQGRLSTSLAARAADPALGGRLHVLEAVPPEDLPSWIHGADVAVVAIEPNTLNHRLSTPNKLFEALGAGVPVVASDFPPIRHIVIDDPDGPLGVMCDPTDSESIAAGIRELLDLDQAARADLRARCLRAAHARYAWEIDAAALTALYDRLTSAGTPAGA